MNYNYFEKYIIDINILVGFVLEDNITQTERQEDNNNRFKNLTPEQTLIPDFILTEFTTLMLKVIPNRYKSISEKQSVFSDVWEKTIAFLDEIEINATIVSPTNEDMRNAIAKFHTVQVSSPRQTAITLTDLLLVTLTEKYSAYLLTNERKLHLYTETENILIKDAIPQPYRA